MIRFLVSTDQFAYIKDETAHGANRLALGSSHGKASTSDLNGTLPRAGCGANKREE